MHLHAKLVRGDYSAQQTVPLLLVESAGLSELTCTAGLMRVSSSSLIMATICRVQRLLRGRAAPDFHCQ